MKASLASNAQPIPELTDVQKKWVTNLQKDNPDLPVGYARALVELYVTQPELFTRENIDKWAAEKPPLMQSTHGEVRVLSAEEATEFEARLPAANAETVCEPSSVPAPAPELQSTLDADNAKFFQVTDIDGNQVQL